MKMFGLWPVISASLLKILLMVAKGAVHVSSATLWEKDGRSKLFCLWLLYIFAWIFFHWQKKLALGVKTTT